MCILGASTRIDDPRCQVQNFKLSRCILLVNRRKFDMPGCTRVSIGIDMDDERHLTGQKIGSMHEK